jgi:pimeloyl-ACP methyl ester carboxylesterase
MTNPIVLIHGAWMTPAGWDFFRARYEEQGYSVLAPPWPLEDVPIDELRRFPNPELAKMTVRKIVDHYDRLIRALPEEPIIIGHSYGGLFTQLLLDRGLGAVGVALDPVPIAGVFPPPRVLLSALPVFLTWRGWDRVLPMSFSSFATTFAQTLPEELKRPYYEKYWAPTPGRLYYEGAVGIGTKIQPDNPNRAPLLLCVGGKDITITPPTVLAAYNIQKRAPSTTEYKVFSGRSHFLFHEPGWEEVADYVLEWARDHIRPPSIGVQRPFPYVRSTDEGSRPTRH